MKRVIVRYEQREYSVKGITKDFQSFKRALKEQIKNLEQENGQIELIFVDSEGRKYTINGKQSYQTVARIIKEKKIQTAQLQLLIANYSESQNEADQQSEEDYLEDRQAEESSDSQRSQPVQSSSSEENEDKESQASEQELDDNIQSSQKNSSEIESSEENSSQEENKPAKQKEQQQDSQRSQSESEEDEQKQVEQAIQSQEQHAPKQPENDSQKQLSEKSQSSEEEVVSEQQESDVVQSSSEESQQDKQASPPILQQELLSSPSQQLPAKIQIKMRQQVPIILQAQEKNKRESEQLQLLMQRSAKDQPKRKVFSIHHKTQEKQQRSFQYFQANSKINDTLKTILEELNSLRQKVSALQQEKSHKVELDFTICNGCGLFRKRGSRKVVNSRALCIFFCLECDSKYDIVVKNDH